MKYLYLLLFTFLISSSTKGQTESNFKQETRSYQTSQNEKFKHKNTSPLKAKDLNSFECLKFYGPKKAYKVVAKFIRTEGAEPFEMATTTDRKPVYEKYGELHFKIKGKPVQLNVYQSHDGRRNPLYRRNLFLPFKDGTNSKTTYGGGRFLDLKIPEGDTITLDFNKAYNPYCAYNSKYSCPIVPLENHTDVKIKAGVKRFDNKH